MTWTIRSSKSTLRRGSVTHPKIHHHPTHTVWVIPLLKPNNNRTLIWRLKIYNMLLYTILRFWNHTIVLLKIYDHSTRIVYFQLWSYTLLLMMVYFTTQSTLTMIWIWPLSSFGVYLNPNQELTPALIWNRPYWVVTLNGNLPQSLFGTNCEMIVNCPNELWSFQSKIV